MKHEIQRESEKRGENSKEIRIYIKKNPDFLLTSICFSCIITNVTVHELHTGALFSGSLNS